MSVERRDIEPVVAGAARGVGGMSDKDKKLTVTLEPAPMVEGPGWALDRRFYYRYQDQVWSITSIQGGDSGDLAGLIAELRVALGRIVPINPFVADASMLRCYFCTLSHSVHGKQPHHREGCSWVAANVLLARTDAAPLPPEAGEPMGTERNGGE